MKIIMVIPTLELAGAEKMCEALSIYLNKTNEVIVISLYNIRTSITDELKKYGIKVIFLNKKRGFDFSTIISLRKVLVVEKPDVIHTHLDSLKYVAFATVFLKVPVMIHTIHNIANKEASGITQLLYKICFKYRNVIPVALSPEIKSSISIYYGIKYKRIPMIFNGIDLDKCIKKQSYENKKIIFTHVGRFSLQKNHRLLIDAYKKISEEFHDTELWLIGDGELVEQIKTRVFKYNLENKVVFWGLRDDVLKLLNKSDVFVLPSKYEGVPISIIEAMGTGLPVIATDTGGVKSMVKDNINGLLINCDTNELYIAMKKMKSKTIREKYGQASVIIANKKFSVRGMAEAYLKLYNIGMKRYENSSSGRI